MEIRNAKITGTMLGREDHGIMTFMVYVDISDSGSCGIGGVSHTTPRNSPASAPLHLTTSHSEASKNVANGECQERGMRPSKL